MVKVRWQNPLNQDDNDKLKNLTLAVDNNDEDDESSPVEFCMYGFLGDVCWWWFPVVDVAVADDEKMRPSSSTLLKSGARILLNGHVEFSRFKIVLKVSWNSGLSTSSVVIAQSCSAFTEL